jgi:hypothetical protein
MTDNGPVDRKSWPFLVHWGLLGIPDRQTAWALILFCLALTVAGVLYGWLTNPIGYMGCLMIVAAVWYYLAIRWVDRNSRWK